LDDVKTIDVKRSGRQIQKYQCRQNIASSIAFIEIEARMIMTEGGCITVSVAYEVFN